MRQTLASIRQCSHARQRVSVNADGIRSQRCERCGQAIGRPLPAAPQGGGWVKSLGLNPFLTPQRVETHKQVPGSTKNHD